MTEGKNWGIFCKKLLNDGQCQQVNGMQLEFQVPEINPSLHCLLIPHQL